MFGTISESEMRRPREEHRTVGAVSAIGGGDVTRAFMRDAGEYEGGASAVPSLFPVPVAVMDWSDDGARLRSYLIPGANVIRNLVSAMDKDALAAAGQR